jgi:hypothetical protein
VVPSRQRKAAEARGNSGQPRQTLFRLSGRVFGLARRVRRRQDAPRWAVGEPTLPGRTSLRLRRPVGPGRGFWAAGTKGRGAVPRWLGRTRPACVADERAPLARASRPGPTWTYGAAGWPCRARSSRTRPTVRLWPRTGQRAGVGAGGPEPRRTRPRTALWGGVAGQRAVLRAVRGPRRPCGGVRRPTAGIPAGLRSEALNGQAARTEHSGSWERVRWQGRWRGSHGRTNG